MRTARVGQVMDKSQADELQADTLQANTDKMGKEMEVGEAGDTDEEKVK
jgi:hypothetical protein